jgi:exosortase B
MSPVAHGLVPAGSGSGDGLDMSETSPGLDWYRHPMFAAGWLLVGLLSLYLPTYIDLANTMPGAASQGHELVVLGVSSWLIWRQRKVLAGLPSRPVIWGWPLLIFGLALYVLGRSQDILLFEIGSQILVFSSVLLVLKGVAAVRLLTFPLLYLIFMVPLPSALVDAFTLPMKTGVSLAAEQVLYLAGYPISRSGVILQVGQYQLLVADACAGLHTLFTLEALGVLYMHLVKHASVVRNILLAIWIVPISFCANVIRVVVLTVITYHLGDDAGQGFMHGFSGMVLFVSALMLIVGIDNILQWIVGRKAASSGNTPQ